MLTKTRVPIPKSGTGLNFRVHAKSMSTAFQRRSAAEYLATERKATAKSEYFDGEIFAMSGGSPSHSLIAANFIGESQQGLKGKPCSVYTSDLRVKVDLSGLYTYPDATIACGELEFDDDQQDTLTNPIVVVEVLSQATESYDRGRKSANYRTIASLQEIILIAQDRPHVERYVRQETGGCLLLEQTELEGTFDVGAAAISIEMRELYRDVSFPPELDLPVAE